MTVIAERAKTYASFIKVEHTLFSIPLVFAGLVLYTHGWPSGGLCFLIIVAAMSGRVMAMGLNRIIDAQIDAQNPRTRKRELPRGAMRRKEAWTIVLIASLVYFVSASAIAPICLWLSPLPVFLFLVYPSLKRWTVWSHAGLGLTWSMAPLGGWLAGSKSLSGLHEVFWLWLFCVLWVTGFDIIYATMDEAFDRTAGLHSLPARFGKHPALRVAVAVHLLAFLSLTMLWYEQLYSPVAFMWLAAIGALFVWQHAIAERRPAFAFFQLNGILGFLVLGFVITGMR